MSIGGENYERSIIPVHSDISRFSRGTDGQRILTVPPLQSYGGITVVQNWTAELTR